MKQIQLTQGQFALVDDEDFENINTVKWFASQLGRKPNKKFYAAKQSASINGKRNVIYLHRYILGLTKESKSQVDHIDGNSLNNQKNNLRLCTHQQNMWNVTKRKNSSTGIKGVYRANNKFVAKIKFNNKKIHLGTFDTPEKAFDAYKKAAIMYHGEFANIE